MTLTLDLSLHPTPIIALMLSNPGVSLSYAELRAALPAGGSMHLKRLVDRGHLTATPGEDGRLRYSLGRVPDRIVRPGSAPRVGRVLPTDPTLHRCSIIALLLANPGVTITTPDVRATLPDHRSVSQKLSTYTARGITSSTPQEDGWRGYTLLRLPDDTRRNLTPEQREERAREERRKQQERYRARKARGMTAPRPAKAPRPTKPASEKRVRLALTQAQRDVLDAEKKAKRAEDARQRTAQIVREDSAAILAQLEGHADPLTEGRLRDLTGLNRGRLQQSLRALRDQGSLRITRQHGADLYGLLRVDLPDRPARMTPDARRVQAHLSTRPGDTIPYMAHELRLTRDAIRDALGTLRALNLLEWTAVGDLPVFRLTRPQEVRNAAD